MRRLLERVGHCRVVGPRLLPRLIRLVLKKVLTIGCEAMKAFFAMQARYFHWSTAASPDGLVLRYSDERRGLFYSIFGHIEFKRSYYCGAGCGIFPMDAAVNLPPKGASDLHRMMFEELSLSMSYEDLHGVHGQVFPGGYLNAGRSGGGAH